MLCNKQILWGAYKLNDASIFYSSNVEQKIIEKLSDSIEGRYYGQNMFITKINKLLFNDLTIKAYNQRPNGYVLADIIIDAQVVLFQKFNVFEMVISDVMDDDTMFARANYKDLVDVSCFVDGDKKKHKVDQKVLCVLDNVEEISLKNNHVNFKAFLFTPETFIRSLVYKNPIIIKVDQFTSEQKQLLADIKQDYKLEWKALDNSKEKDAVHITEGKVYIFPAKGNDFNDLFTSKFMLHNDDSAKPSANSSEILTGLLYQKKYNLTIPKNYFH
jgi:hypothetical protein